MANREKARIAEAKYRAAHLSKVRARQAAYRRKIRKTNPDVIRAKARAYYRAQHAKLREQARTRYKKNADKERTYSAKYRACNKERANATVRAWRQANPEKAKAIGKAWARNNPAAVHAMRKRRKALIRGATINDFTAEQWSAIQRAFNYCCAYCDKPCKGELAQDHVIPLSKGGAHTASNIVPACTSCNSRKHTGPPLRPLPSITL
jgi:5-methylcytosine-specific restriction endonuclease McrA